MVDDLLPDPGIPMEGIHQPYMDDAMEDIQPTDPPPNDSDSEADYYSRYIFNTNNQISSREMMKSRTGGYDEDDWVLGMEELHADQVDRDRYLAIAKDMDLPKFVRFHLSERIFLPHVLLFRLSLRGIWRVYIGTWLLATTSPTTTITLNSSPCTGIPPPLKHEIPTSDTSPFRSCSNVAC